MREDLREWPLWAAAQNSRFLFSVLPGLWMWLGMAPVLTGIGMGSLALIPGDRL